MGCLTDGRSGFHIVWTSTESREEAEQMGYDLNIETEWNGNSVFCNEAELCADGTPRDIEVELIDGEEDEE